MKYRVLEGAAPELYGKDVKVGDTLSLTKIQAAHLLAKGHIEEAGVDEEDAPATPAPAEKAAAALTIPAGDPAPRAKGSANGNRD